jgi:hypothetical protein
MSIASLGTVPVRQTIATAATHAMAASSAQGPFSAQLQALRASQSGTGSSATQTAYHTEPGRGAPSKAHRPHARNASNTDANAANGTDSSQSTSGDPSAASGTSGSSSSGQQTPGAGLLNSMMRGLQAYGATTTLM